MWPFAGNKKRLVLLVDDDSRARLLLATLFGDSGWDVAEARDGKEGVEAAVKLRPDLVLLDVDMPVLSGFDALALLRENPATARIPVVMATARSTLSDVERCLGRGATDYVLKPFELPLVMLKADKLVPPPTA